MRRRRPFVEPAWVSRLLAPSRIERVLALAVAVLSGGAVAGVVIGLLRELGRDRVPDSVCITGIVVIGILETAYWRWLRRRLRREDEPHWRLAPRDGRRLLPGTFLAFWTAGGFASYSEPWHWALSGLTAVLLAVVVVPSLLQRLSRRHGKVAAA